MLPELALRLYPFPGAGLIGVTTVAATQDRTLTSENKITIACSIIYIHSAHNLMQVLFDSRSSV